jgi:hypothetical protein
MLSMGLGVLCFAISSLPEVMDKDVTQYWASGKLLLHHANPYDERSVYLLEMGAGSPITRLQVMFNPPCTLPFALPLGLLSVHAAIFVWMLVIVACLILSIRILWIMHGRRTDRLHLLCYVFPPVLACVELAQIVPVVLLGLVLFLWLVEDRPLLAGLCIPLLAFKPQLLLAFGVVVLIWAIKGRRYRFLFGMLLGFLVTCGISFSFDHQIFIQYIPVLQSANGISHRTLNLSSQLYRLHPGSCLQYVPVTCASCWATIWYLRRGDAWDWSNEGLLLLAVSVVVAPYSWFEDEALMIPAVLTGIYGCWDSGRSLIGFALLDGAVLMMVLFHVEPASGAYVWTSVAWLGWVIYARRVSGLRVTQG